jgi:DNA-binding IclR family transcriptional regulator
MREGDILISSEEQYRSGRKPMTKPPGASPAARRERANGTSEPSDNQFVVRALAKGLAMLGLFDAEHREWSLDEMTSVLGLPRMTSYRMARTLQSAGYLVTDGASGRYRLGPSLLAATYLSEGYADLVVLARPYLEALVEQTGESVTLAVEIDGVAVCVAMVDSPRPHRREVAVGRVIGDTANSHGKMFAACKPDAVRDRIVNSVHEQHTIHTITDPQALALTLEEARRSDVAFDMEERDIGTCSVAAPVRDQMGEVIASLAVVVPTGRFGPEAKDACAAAVKAAAAAFSAFFGYAGTAETTR